MPSLPRVASGSRCVGLVPVAVAVCLLAGTAGHAQVRPSPSFTPPVRFERQGLPLVTAFDIQQDSRGFIWMASESGLFQWDGYRAHLHRPVSGRSGETGSLNTNHVVEDHQGNIWGSTDNGLVRIDATTGHVTLLHHRPGDSSTLSRNNLTSLIVDRKGVLWVAAQGLDRYDAATGAFTHLASDPANPGTLSDNEINEMALGPDGTIWVGTNRGLDRLDPATGRVVRYATTSLDPRAAPVLVNALTPAGEGRLWVGTRLGAYCFDPATGSFAPVLDGTGKPAPSLQHYIRSVRVTRDGRVWFGTDGGLVALDPRGPTVTHYRAGNSPDTLRSNRVRTLFVDRDGALWVGSQGAGLCRYDPGDTPVAVYRHDPRNSDTPGLVPLFGIAEAPDGTLWLGTDSAGVERLDLRTGDVRRFKVPRTVDTTVPADVIRDVAVDPDGRVWAGTYGGGLLRIEGSSGHIDLFDEQPGRSTGLDSNHVRAVYRDSRGTMWFGTSTGRLHRYDRRTGTIERIEGVYGGQEASGILAITGSPDGTLWASTYGHGLLRLDPTGHDQVYRANPWDPSTLSSDTIWSIFVDREGLVWLGTFAGLNALDPRSGRVRRYGEADGLPGEAVKGIVEDASGALWVAADGGLARLDRTTHRFARFNPGDAVVAGSFSLKTALSTRDGLLCFGGPDGLVVFDPSRIAVNTTPPPVVLTGLLLFGQPAPVGAPGSPLSRRLDLMDELVLRPGQDSFGLEFVALGYRVASRNRYRFKLDGLTSQWVDVDSTNRVANFTGLPPGTYTFHVVASNNDGVWNNIGARLRIVVLPPWWRSDWARATYAALLIGLVVAFVQARSIRHRREMARQVALNEQLERRVHDRTEELEAVNRDLEGFTYTVSHDLRAPLRAIDGFASMLLAQHRDSLSEGAARCALVIRERAAQMARLIDDLLAFSRLGRHQLVTGPVDMAQLVGVVLADLAPDRGDRDVEIVVGPLPPARGDRMLLKQVWLNLLSNAQKFTRGRAPARIEVGSEPGERGSVYFVRDNGAGFDRANAQRLFGVFQRYHSAEEFEGTGVGLAIVARIVERHGGQVWADSRPGEGAVFRFVLGEVTPQGR